MSHTFDLKFNRMRENAPERTDVSESMDRHDQPGHDRKVCFIFLDGSRRRMNYGLLVDEEYYPDKNMIVLNFTSCTVALSGVHLETLFDEFETNKPRVIVCVDSRYNQIQEGNHPVVNQIDITKNR